MMVEIVATISMVNPSRIPPIMCTSSQKKVPKKIEFMRRLSADVAERMEKMKVAVTRHSVSLQPPAMARMPETLKRAATNIQGSPSVMPKSKVTTPKTMWMTPSTIAQPVT